VEQTNVEEEHGEVLLSTLLADVQQRNILPTRLSRKMELVLALNLAMRKVA
jgi:hypothetical protein